MFNESDKEQIEQLKKLWNEYGRLLIVAIVIGLGCGYGWQYWQKYKHERNLQAAYLYQHFLVTDDQQQQAKDLAELSDSHKSSAYVAFAKMSKAAKLVETKHYEEALQELGWVREHAKSKNLKDLATVRKARVLLALHRTQQSLDLLLNLQDSMYQPIAYELEGDAYAALGKTQQAAEAYQKAKEAYARSKADNVLIDRKANSPILVPN